MSEKDRKLIPRPWDKPLVWNPNVDITGIEPEDITAQVVGQGVQVIGGVRPPAKPLTGGPTNNSTEEPS